MGTAEWSLVISCVALIASGVSAFYARRAHGAATHPVVSLNIKPSLQHQESYIAKRLVLKFTDIEFRVSNHHPTITIIDVHLSAWIEVKRFLFFPQRISIENGRLTPSIEPSKEFVLCLHRFRGEIDMAGSMLHSGSLEDYLGATPYQMLRATIQPSTTNVIQYEVLEHKPLVIRAEVSYQPAVYPAKRQKVKQVLILPPAIEEYEPGKFVIIGWDTRGL